MRLKGWMWKIKLFIFIVFLTGVVFLWKSPFGQEMKSVVVKGYQVCAQKTNWQLKQVEVIGTKRTTKEAWSQVLNLESHQSMREVDLAQLRLNLLKLPWIKEVVVARYLPNKLRIDITEKTPIALWQNQGVYRPLDEYAKVVEDSTFVSDELILVVGGDAPEHTLDLLRALEKVPEIAPQIRSAARVEGRRWNLYTTNGVKIFLPQTNIQQALIRLKNQNETDQLLKKEVESIDMRLDDRITLHPKKGTSKTKKGKK